MVYKGDKESWSWEENLSRVSVSTVPADGIAPLGARPSAGTVMTKFKPSTCKGLSSWGIKTEQILQSNPFWIEWMNNVIYLDLYTKHTTLYLSELITQSFLHTKPWIQGGEKSIFTDVIH